MYRTLTQAITAHARRIILSILLLPTLGQAATLTVSPGESLRAALGRMQGGDTLILQPGVYRENIPDGAIPSGTPGQPTIIQSATPRGAIIEIEPGAHRGITLGKKGLQHDIVLDGLVLDGNRGSSSQPTGAMAVYQVRGITVQNGEIRNLYGTNDNDTFHGISYATNMVIRGNLFHDLCRNDRPNSCPSCYCYGIYFGSNNVIEDNEFRDITGHALHGWSCPGCPQVTGNRIQRNRFTRTGGLIVGRATGSGRNTVSENVFQGVGTTLSPWARDAIVLGGTGNTLARNVIVDGGGECIRLRDQARGNTITATTCAGNRSNRITGGSGNAITGTSGTRPDSLTLPPVPAGDPVLPPPAGQPPPHTQPTPPPIPPLPPLPILMG